MPEKCSEPFTMLWTPTGRLQAETVAQQKGLSVAALVRSLVAEEFHRLTIRVETPTTDSATGKAAP